MLSSSIVPGASVSPSLANRDVVGIATVFEAEGEFRPTLHGHPLSACATPGEDLVVVSQITIIGNNMDAYPYPFKGTEPPPKHLSGMTFYGMYAWHLKLMRPRGLPGPSLRSAGASGPRSRSQERSTAIARGTRSTTQSPRSRRLPTVSRNTRLSKTVPLPGSEATTPSERRMVGYGSIPLLPPTRASVKNTSSVRTPSGDGVVSAKKVAPHKSQASVSLSGVGTGQGGNSTEDAGAVYEDHTPIPVPEYVAEESRGSVKVARDLGTDSDEVQIVSEVMGQSNDRTLYSEEDVVEPVQVDTQFSKDTIRLQDYKAQILVVDLDFIRLPEHSPRGIEEEHVQSLENELERKGLLESAGLMSVTIRMNGRPLEACVQNGRIIVSPDLVDGRHRRLAMFRRRIKETRWYAVLKSLRVLSWSRPDGKDLTSHEIVEIGVLLNDTASSVLRMRFSDRIHSVVSIINSLHVDLGVVVGELTVEMVIGALQNSAVTKKVEERQLHRISEIALKLANNPMLVDVFERVCAQYSNMGIMYMSSDKLLRMEPLEFTIAMNCLMFYVGPKGPSIRGGFEMVRSYLYSTVLQFLEEMKRMALGVEVEMESFLAQSFWMSASVTGETTVRDFAVEQVNHFRKVLNPRNQGSVIIRAVALFKGNLEKWIPELRVEPDVQEASVSQPDAIREPVTSVVNTGNSRLGTTRSVPESQGGSKPPTPPASVAFSAESGTLAVGSDQWSAVRRSTRRKSSRSSSAGAASSESGRRKERRNIRRKKGGAILTAATVQRLRTNEPDVVFNFFKDNDLLQLLRKGFEEIDMELDSEDESVEFEDETGTNEQSAQGFDDELPTAWPSTVSRSEPSNTDNPLAECCVYSIMLPSVWPQAENPIQNVGAWLQCIHLPPGHQAETLSPGDLKNIHHTVFYHAAMLGHEQSGLMKGNILGGDFISKMAIAAGVSTEDLSSYDRLYLAAKKVDYLALEYFGQKRAELKEKGFCILPGFAIDRKFEVLPNPSEDVDSAKSVLAFFRQNYTEQPDLLREENRKRWTWIINSGPAERDIEQGAKGEGRFTTTRAGMVDVLEEDPSTHWVVKGRAVMDARLGQVMTALRVGNNRRAETRKMYAPKTGGRVLATTRQCMRQTLHTDFRGLSVEEKAEGANPGYFMMIAGEYSFPIWVCEGSHKIVVTDWKSLRNVSKGMVVTKVLVPPFSIFFGRGDIFHAGAGGADSSMHGVNFRYHMYMVPEGYDLPDAVHREKGFKPQFVEEDIRLYGAGDETGVVGDGEEEDLVLRDLDEEVVVLENDSVSAVERELSEALGENIDTGER